MADTTQVEAFFTQQELQLRFLCPSDVGEVRKLCLEWFPIEYPDSWYNDITSSSRFYSLAATYKSHIIGLIVAELKPKSKMNKEDRDILASGYPPGIHVAYILSLGVVGAYRRLGIASLLLDSLLSYLTSKEHVSCKAVYLHVLATNCVAIRFYERRNFQPHSLLPFYYSIQGKPRDGYSYVLYVNGGQPPWSLIDYISHCGKTIAKLQPCRLPHHLYRAVCNMIHRFLSHPPVRVTHSS